MKILLVYPNWLGKSGDYCHRAAQALGYESRLVWGSEHRVLGFSGFWKDKARRAPLIKTTFKRRETIRINKNIVDEVKRFRPDIVINNSPEIYPETVEQLRQNTGCLIFWAGDDPTLYPSLMKTLQLYDFMYFGSEAWINESLRQGRKKENHYLPYGYDETVFGPVQLTASEQRKYGSQVAFVGARYSQRERVLASLGDIDLGIWGWDTDHFLRRTYRRLRGGNQNVFQEKYGTSGLYLSELNGRIRGFAIDSKVANKIYNASSLMLNLQHPQMVQAVNPKTFEIAAAGGFQILEHSGELCGLFEKDKEIVCFEHPDELKEKIDYYLKNPHEMDKISTAARIRAEKEHKFEHRVQYMISIAGRS